MVKGAGGDPEGGGRLESGSQAVGLSGQRGAEWTS